VGIDLRCLDDTTLTFTVTSEDANGNVTEYEIRAVKDTEAPELVLDEVTVPIDSDNADEVEIKGTGEVGATITVVATDGVDSTIVYMTTVDGDGNWLIEGIDVSALADGTITFNVTATDAVGNTTDDQITAEKTSAAPLALMAEDEDDDEGLDAVAAALADSGDDPNANDEALADEDEWIYS
jgi:hypothetical protein